LEGAALGTWNAAHASRQFHPLDLFTTFWDVTNPLVARPVVLITWLFLTARAALRAKVWRVFRFRHSGLTSVLSTPGLAALPDRFPSAQLRLLVMHSFWLAFFALGSLPATGLPNNLRQDPF
jgi:hypothetical protein